MTDNKMVSVLIIVLSVVQYISVETGAQGKSFLKTKWKYKWSGVLTYIFFNVLLLWLTNSLQIACNITVVLTTVLSIANHYVYDMHGTPFTMDIIKNTGTALNVISAYRIKISRQIWCVIALTAIQLAAVNTVFVHYSAERAHIIVWVILFTVVFYLQYFGEKAFVPKTIVTWPWSRIIAETGYISGFVHSTIRLFRIVQPVGKYDEKQTERFINSCKEENTSIKTPDIIFVLNETLYDLNQITDTGEKTLEYIRSLKTAAKGYAVCPAVGGGTNKSEYEFLTSNSLYIAPNITPFYSLDTKGTNSVAGYLKAKGYTTLATHPAPGANYSRTAGYANLGFEKCCFIEDYNDIKHFGSRMFATDESAYSNFIKMYEEMDDGPRFAYLLTIQNHGGYVFNKPEENTVNIKKDFGTQTGKINEFLSCMQLSDKAFEKLIKYFEKSEREVIICMMGDHAPDFAKNIIDGRYSEEEKELLLRSVPYVVWSNKVDLSDVKLPKKLAMPFIAPMVCDIAGTGSCGYYKYINELSEDVPVITSYGVYQDKNGICYNYSEKNEYTEKVNRYFDFVYSNMTKKEFMKKFTH